MLQLRWTESSLFINIFLLHLLIKIHKESVTRLPKYNTLETTSRKKLLFFWILSKLPPARLWDNCQLSTVRSDNCQCGQLSVGTTVSGPTVSRPWTTVRGNCQSYEKTVRSYSCPLPNCQRKLSELWKKFKLYPVFISIPISQAAAPGPRSNRRKKPPPATTSRW